MSVKSNFEHVKKQKETVKTKNVLDNFTSFQNKHETLNGAMNVARKAKMDEWYTPYETIENEMNVWLEINPEFFKDKHIVCPSDRVERELFGKVAPETASQFWTYFHLNFEKLGLKQLTATYLKNDNEEHSYRYDYFGGDDNNIFSFKKQQLENDGNFFNEEIIQILKEADYTITNPPFSLWSKWYNVLLENNIDFLVIGNKLSVGYSNVFPNFIQGKYNLAYTTPKYFLKYPSGAGGSEEESLVSLSGLTSWITNLPVVYKKRDIFKEQEVKEYVVEYIDGTDIVNINKLKEIEEFFKDYIKELAVPITFAYSWDKDASPYKILRQLEKDKCFVNGVRKFTRLVIKKKNA
ncbi:adenine-specific methyltransferase EcoRI family protein [Mycoplasma sp. Sp48II]|uniref:adenine-specific methyltransferase EcoRI family protein n=1 Tax=Mycoplasma sp. Sp48II TaxID=3401682 RepID=UPI003AAFA006